MNFHIAKVATTFIKNVIQLLKLVTSFTWLKQGEIPPRIIKCVNYVNLSANCVKIPGTKGIKFIPL